LPDQLLEYIDATPSKKILQSLSTDTDLKKGILELVDNSIDEWKLRGKSKLHIELTLDPVNKSISYRDDAGGIKEVNLTTVVQPGGTTRTSEEASIGEFGIGLKRAIVSISTRAEVISRFESNETFKIIVDHSWTSSGSWMIPKYKTNPIPEGHTIINFTTIKFDLNLNTVSEIKQALADTYALNFSKDFTILVNNDPIRSPHRIQWAYLPQGCHPRTYKSYISIENRKVGLELTVGVKMPSNDNDEYGFDIYCNDRMILKNYKHSEIGFVSGQLGFAQKKIACFKGIVKISGASKDIPWNSTKSALNFSNLIFPQLKTKLITLAKPYVQLSRRLSDDPTQITRFPVGQIQIVDLTSTEDLHLGPNDLPHLPPAKRTQADILLKRNEDAVRENPWTRALIENIYVADLVMYTLKLENKNRFALLLLDTCLEVAFRDYIIRVARIDLGPDKKNILSSREKLNSIIKKREILPVEMWNQIDYFYDLRCSLYHELASLEIPDTDIENFRYVVGSALFLLHHIDVKYTISSKVHELPDTSTNFTH